MKYAKAVGSRGAEGGVGVRRARMTGERRDLGALEVHRVRPQELLVPVLMTTRSRKKILSRE